MKLRPIFLTVLLLLQLNANSQVGDSNPRQSAELVEKRFTELLQNKEYNQALTEINALIAYGASQKEDSLFLFSVIRKAELLRKLRDRMGAYELLQKHAELTEKRGMQNVSAYYYNRKAAILHELDRQVEALQAVSQAQTLDSILDYKGWRQISNLSIKGAAYRDLGEFDKAQIALRKASKLALKVNDLQGYSETLYNLIYTFKQSEKHDSVIVYAHKLLTNQLFIQDQISHYKTIKHLSQSFFQLGMLDSAYLYADSAYSVAVSQMRTIVDDRVKMYQASDRLYKEQLENKILEAENQRQVLWNLILIIVLVTISLVAFLIYRQRGQYKSLNQSKQVANAQLSDSLNFNNKLIGIIAHDIRNPMSNITSLVELYRIGGLEEEDMRHLMLQLEDASQNVNLLLENLLRWVKSQESGFTPNYTHIDLNHLIESVIRQTQTLIDNKKVDVRVSAEGRQIVGDIDFISLIIRNLLTNSIKFSKRGGRIDIIANKEEEHCFIQVKDQGIGMSAKKIAELLNGKSKTTVGTQSEVGTGLGVKLVKELTEALGGELSFQSEEGKGTVAIVGLPKCS